MDLEADADFEATGIQLVSISPDPPEVWRQQTREHRITTPLLSDADNVVAQTYGVMRWRVPQNADVESAEPGHTFVLVDERGVVRWVRDYGAPEHEGVMYVFPWALLQEIRRIS